MQTHEKIHTRNKYSSYKGKSCLLKLIALGLGWLVAGLGGGVGCCFINDTKRLLFSLTYY